MSQSVEGDGPENRATGALPPRLDIEALTPMLESTSGRVQEVLRATDLAAEEILRSAQADAQRYVEEARLRAERLTHDRMDRIASLTEDLMAQAGTIHRQAQDLRVALSQTLTKLSEELGIERPLDGRTAAEPDAPAAAPAGDAPAVSPAPAVPAPAPEASVSDDGSIPTTGTPSDGEPQSLLGRLSRKRRRGDSEESLDDARVAIVQMLASGESRDRIEQRLRDEFGIDDPSTVFATPSSEPTRP